MHFLSVLFEKSSVFVFMLISDLESLKSIMKSHLCCDSKNFVNDFVF